MAACQQLAVKYNVSLSKVLKDETNAAHVYAELILDGLEWDTRHGEWARTLSGKQVQRTKIQLRIMSSEDEVATRVAQSLIVEVLAEAGILILGQSPVRNNLNADGARAYVEIAI